MVMRMNVFVYMYVLIRSLKKKNQKNKKNAHTQVEEAGLVLQRLRKHEGVGITVIRGEELREKGFGGLYGVGKAAERPPALVVLSKAGSGAMAGKPPVVWVGMGIVYDTGGLSIKTKVSFFVGGKVC
jgi:leucyl aminopeptidase